MDIRVLLLTIVAASTTAWAEDTASVATDTVTAPTSVSDKVPTDTLAVSTDTLDASTEPSVIDSAATEPAHSAFAASGMHDAGAADSNTIEVQTGETANEGSGEPLGSYGEGNPFGGGGGGAKGLSSFSTATHAREAGPVKLDIARAVTFCTPMVSPDEIETTSETGFAWDIGLDVPLRPWLRVGIALRYQHVAFRAKYDESLPVWPSPVDTADTGTPALPSPGVSVETREELRFLSLPVDIEFMLKLGRVSPYVFGVIEPSLFISGNYLAEEKITLVFEDKAVLTWEKTYDRDVGNDREKYHVLVGGGLGVEYEYGFGSFYLAGGCMVALTDLGEKNTMPERTASTLVIFPLTFGLRFGI